MIEKVNGIYRISLKYKSLLQRNVIGYKKILFPTRPKVLVKSFLDFFRKKDLSRLTDERAIIDFHDVIYDSNHKILAVGIGAGISLIYNSKLSRKNKFIGIEASKNQIEITKINARLNQVSDNSYQIIEGFAGDSKGVYGDESQISENIVDINDYDFDVLELDCEGSEIELLENLIKHPKYIIVEMHPTIIDIDLSNLLSNLNTKGYKMIDAKTVSGKDIKLDKLGEFFDSKIVEKKLNEKQSWGDILPVLLFEG